MNSWSMVTKLWWESVEREENDIEWSVGIVARDEEKRKEYWKECGVVSGSQECTEYVVQLVNVVD